MQRTERVVYLGVLSVFNFLGNMVAEAFGFGPDDYLLKLALILMLVFSSYTAVQRMFHVMTELKKRDEQRKIEHGTIP
jgi:fumarate reductase subunit D